MAESPHGVCFLLPRCLVCLAYTNGLLDHHLLPSADVPQVASTPIPTNSEQLFEMYRTVLRDVRGPSSSWQFQLRLDARVERVESRRNTGRSTKGIDVGQVLALARVVLFRDKTKAQPVAHADDDLRAAHVVEAPDKPLEVAPESQALRSKRDLRAGGRV